MTLQQLRIVAAVARAGTFGAAALDLGISQGAVSQAVASLEKELAVRLFDRGNDGARPTAVGSRVLEHAVHVLRLETAIHEETSLERGELSATLRVEAFDSIAVHVLPVVLARLAARHPGLRVDLVKSKVDSQRHTSLDTLDALGAADIDVGFLQLPLGDDDALETVLVWPLIEESYVAIVARRHLGPDHTGDRCDDQLLARLPIALDVSAACAMLVTTYLQSRIGRVDARYRADDATMIQLVAQGAALGMLPRSAAASLPDAVVRLEVDDAPVRVLAVGIAPTALKVPAVRAFLGELGSRFPEAGLPPGPAVGVFGAATTG